MINLIKKFTRKLTTLFKQKTANKKVTKLKDQSVYLRLIVSFLAFIITAAGIAQLEEDNCEQNEATYSLVLQLFIVLLYLFSIGLERIAYFCRSTSEFFCYCFLLLLFSAVLFVERIERIFLLLW